MKTTRVTFVGVFNNFLKITQIVQKIHQTTSFSLNIIVWYLFFMISFEKGRNRSIVTAWLCLTTDHSCVNLSKFAYYTVGQANSINSLLRIQAEILIQFKQKYRRKLFFLYNFYPDASLNLLSMNF